MSIDSPSLPELPPLTVAELDLPGGLIPALLAMLERVNGVLLDHYNNTAQLEVEHKADDSPVTQADQDAHDLIKKGLASITPGIPVLSEESPDEELAERGRWRACWIVDPLDGTKEFIGRTGEFTVNVALVVGIRPVLGIISVPITGRHYVGVPDSGACRVEGATVVGLTVAGLRPGRALRVLASKRHNPGKVAGVLDRLAGVADGVERVNAGSALKFCSLVDGEAEIYPRTSPCYEWDVAAGDALVHGAGGFVMDGAGNPLEYNCRETLLVEHFIAGVDDSIDWAARLG